MTLSQRLDDLVAVLGFDYKDLDSRIPGILNQDLWHYVGTTGEPAFQNGWTNYGPDRQVRYRKKADGTVVVSGAAKSGSNSTTAFTLPAGYRPAKVTSFTGLFSGGPGQITILTTGEVQLSNLGTSNGAVQAALDVIEFDTDTVGQILVGPPGPTGPRGLPGDSVNVPMDTWHRVGTAGEPAFQNGWASTSGYPVEFRKDPFGKVQIRGMATGGAAGTTVFTLPAGYIPPQNAEFVNIANAAVASRTIVWANGTVVAYSTTTNHSLANCEFDTDTVTQVLVGPKGEQGETGPPGAQPTPTTLLMDTWHKPGTSGEPAFGTPWQAAAVVDAQKPRFRKYPDGKVRIAGFATSTAAIAFGAATSTSRVFTLPAGYRPPAIINTVAMMLDSDGGRVTVRLVIYETGEIRIFEGMEGQTYVGGSGTWICLDNIEFDTETVTELLALKGDKGNPGSVLDALTYIPSYDIDETTSGYGNALTTGRPDNDDYIFTSMETYDPDQASPSGTIFVQTLVGVYYPDKMWRRFKVGPYIGPWKRISTILHTATINGAQEAYSADISLASSATAYIFKDATNVLELLYTPEVDAWVEVKGHIGYVQKRDAAYHYLASQLVIVAGVDVDGITSAADIQTQHSQVNQFGTRYPERTFKCAANVPYQFRILISGNGGLWSYYRGASQLYMSLKAWAR